MYTPSEHLSLDEGMLNWTGCLLLKIYNPLKPDKYGIKAYILCMKPLVDLFMGTACTEGYTELYQTSVMNFETLCIEKYTVIDFVLES